MGLEEIEGIRADLKNLTDQRELNIRDALNSISRIKEKYGSLLKEKGKEYCNENCSDIPVQIDKISKELKSYHI
jgi:hypothetical protein